MVWQMEQEFSKNTFVLQENEEIGSVKIADDVVAMKWKAWRPCPAI